MRYPYGKAILITGASSGIGRAAAELFADAGYTVWAGSRHCEESVEKRQGGGGNPLCFKWMCVMRIPLAAQ